MMTGMIFDIGSSVLAGGGAPIGASAASYRAKSTQCLHKHRFNGRFGWIWQLEWSVATLTINVFAIDPQVWPPPPKRDIPLGTLRSIEKQAGPKLR
jgi:hypothetical protein